MKFGTLDTDKKVLIVAEVGNNHEGDLAKAKEAVAAAAEAGADAVKFQTFRTAHYVGPENQDRVKRLEGFRLEIEDFRALAKVASDSGLEFFSTPFDLGSLEALEGFVPVLKIASGDNTYWPLIEAAARTGLPLIASTGLLDLEGVQFLRSRIREIWRQEDIPDPGLALLHCVSAYPVPPREANLRALLTFAHAFSTETLGYSDHTLGIEAAVLSVALGARIVEKHFTLDKQTSDFRDHQLSADPQEFRCMVDSIRRAEVLLGSPRKEVGPSEAELAPLVRRSIAAGRDLEAGTILSWSDLTWVRPGDGIPAGQECLVLGRELRTKRSLGERILLEHLGEPR